MEPRRPSVVGNADVGAEVDESIQRALLRCPGVARRENADSASSVDEARELIAHESHAMPEKERDDDIDLVGRIDLTGKLAPDAWFARPVDEDGVRSERYFRSGSMSAEPWL